MFEERKTTITLWIELCQIIRSHKIAAKAVTPEPDWFIHLWVAALLRQVHSWFYNSVVVWFRGFECGSNHG